MHWVSRSNFQYRGCMIDTLWCIGRTMECSTTPFCFEFTEIISHEAKIIGLANQPAKCVQAIFFKKCAKWITLRKKKKNKLTINKNKNDMIWHQVHTKHLPVSILNSSNGWWVKCVQSKCEGVVSQHGFWLNHVIDPNLTDWLQAISHPIWNMLYV